ncbi:MAG: hypothetical protein ACK5N0_04910 [Synechococcaceae cyanobacterium]
MPGNSRNPSAPATSEPVVSILYNRYPARTLQLNGKPSAEYIVGSPGTSDLIFGGRTGDNAYVVGGGTATISADGSSVIADSSAEIDELRLDASALDFVNIKPNGQGTPDTLLVPQRNSSGPMRDASGRLIGDPKPVRGSDDLKNTSIPGIRNACPAPVAMAPAGRSLLIGSTATALPFGILGQIPEPELTAALPPPVASKPGPGRFPGVPAVQGFDAGRSDVLVVSADDFPVARNNDPDLINNKAPIPVEIIAASGSAPRGQSSRPSQTTSASPVRGGTAQPTRREIRSKAPLVYFSQNGLLVLSQNSKPLGTPANPGPVIAQLLDVQGAPLKLRPPAGQPYYPSRFLIIRPSATPRTASTLKPTT